jgi:predicted cupin superfamily sugar epimerase
MKTPDAQYWIHHLHLQPPPEGGHYRQTYRADLILEEASLPNGFRGARAASTAIYFLLNGRDFSAFHCLRSYEMWHFYSGKSLLVHVIETTGGCRSIRLGSNPEAGEEFQSVVKAGCWFASELCDPNSYALVGCTVAPGFDFADFELGRREELTQKYPKHPALIKKLTRE